MSVAGSPGCLCLQTFQKTPTLHLPGIPQQLLTPHSELEHVIDPNVVVIHGRRGIEVTPWLRSTACIVSVCDHCLDGIQALHLYSGKQLCQLSLGHNGLYVDLNGDGIIGEASHTRVRESPVSPTQAHYDTLQITLRLWVRAMATVRVLLGFRGT